MCDKRAETALTVYRSDKALQTIQIVIANLPEIWMQMLAQVITRQPDMIVAQRVQGDIELLLAVSRDTDLVILGAVQTHTAPGVCSHLLNEFPALKILVLGFSGNQAAFYWLSVRRKSVEVRSSEMLVNAIRGICQVD